MAFAPVDVGSAVNDPSADTARQAFAKLNAYLAEIGAAIKFDGAKVGVGTGTPSSGLDVQADSGVIINGVQFKNERVTIGNESTHEFTIAAAGEVNGAVYSLYVRTNPNSSQARWFQGLNGNQQSIYVGGEIDFGGTANNDTSGKINIWFDTTNRTVKLKNRTGSAEDFCLALEAITP